MPETADERQKKAQAISNSRILGPEEFKLIQQRQALREVEGARTGGKGKKRKREGDTEDDRSVFSKKTNKKTYQEFKRPKNFRESFLLLPRKIWRCLG